MINKTLIIFDLDQTITNIDTFKTITSMLLTPEETSEIIKKCKNPEINWIPIQNLLYFPRIFHTFQNSFFIFFLIFNI